MTTEHRDQPSWGWILLTAVITGLAFAAGVILQATIGK